MNLLGTPKPLLKATKGLQPGIRSSNTSSTLIEVESKEERINRIKATCGVKDHKKKKKGKRNGKR